MTSHIRMTQMKRENIKVGMEVVDKLGNEYIVTDVDYDEDYNESKPNIMPIRIQCTKFLKIVPVQKFGVSFYGLDDSFWIFKSSEEEVIKNDYMYVENCITAEELKMKDKSK